MGQSLLFQEFRFPHPDTMRWPYVHEMDEFVRRGGTLSHPFPFLVKANESHEGEGIFVVSDPGELESVLEILAAWERTGQSGFISQQRIQTDGNVLRAVILGKRIITYWKRAQHRGDPVISLSRNARVDKDWRGDLQKKARSQARRFSKKTGVNLAAIDFVFPFNDPDPEPLFLEINTYFGRRGFGASLNYYRILYKAIQRWLEERGFDPGSLRLL
jgi:ribosomal protein S6--L-glutamate ligase